MSDETRQEKICYVLYHGGEAPEMCILPFVHAIGAMAMEVKAVVILMSNAVFLAKKGYAQHVRFPGQPQVKEQIDQFFEMGGEVLLCTPCLKERGIDEDDIIEQAEMITVGKFTQKVLEADAVLSY